MNTRNTGVSHSEPQHSEQEWTKLMQQARAYAHCNCPDAPKYHSNCQRHLAPILDKLDAALAAERETKRKAIEAWGTRNLKLVNELTAERWHHKQEEVAANEFTKQLTSQREIYEIKLQDAEDDAQQWHEQFEASQQQLLAAQAAIEAARNTVYAERRDEILNSVDLSLHRG